MSERTHSRIDKLVGHNIRVHRLYARMSRTEFGKYVGVTVQQVLKYEKGVNRVSSGSLFKMASVLRIPVSSLYQGIDGDGLKSVDSSPIALLTEPYALRLMQAFASMKDQKLRRSFVEMAERFASKLKTPAARKSGQRARGRRRPLR